MKRFLTITVLFLLLVPYGKTLAQAEFNPNFIISDAELWDTGSWTRDDIQKFLESKGSYLRNYQTTDINGTSKAAADIIYDAAQRNQVNPKYLLVMLQKEQSLITDDTPSQGQLDWATGYAVCDSCSTSDPKVMKYKGFGPQVDSAAGIMRWYDTNKTTFSSLIKKDTPITIDNQQVTPQSWATAFLYTYNPHLTGNRNFERIWTNWFTEVYPNGSLLQGANSNDVWLIQDSKKRRFANRTVLLTRADPKMIIKVPDIELDNYPTGQEIAYANFSILRNGSTTYLLDFDTLRPFASNEVVRQLGFNPDEIIDVQPNEIASYQIGNTITVSSTPPQGVIYQLAEDPNTYFFLQDGVLKPIADRRVAEVNYTNLKIQKKTRAELAQYNVDSKALILFKDGTLVQAPENNKVYVIENGKRRPIADTETFNALGFNRSNIVSVPLTTLLTFPEGDQLFINASLLSSREKFLGDSTGPISDLAKSKLPAYLVAEFPSGRIISGKALDSARPIASLTKLLTAFETVNTNFKPTKTIGYNDKLYQAVGNSLNLKNGEQFSSNDLLNATLVGSINNTARMLAGTTGLDESTFISNVNQRLANWGADNTSVVDTTGLDEHDVSTPRDLLKIFTKVMADDRLKKVLALPKTTITGVLNKKSNKRTVENSNKLVIANKDQNYKIIASKTGYTDEAGATLIMLVESLKDKKQYVVITMGNTDYQNRFNEPNRLAEWITAGNVQVAKQ